MLYIKKDLDFGLESEKNTIDILKKHFNSDIKFIERKNFVFDFYDDESYYELKTRRNIYNKFPSTMINYNKILYCNKVEDKKVYFIFKFTDGLYYYLYNKSDLENGEIEIKDGGRTDRGRIEIKKYAFIKINKLIKI